MSCAILCATVELIATMIMFNIFKTKNILFSSEAKDDAAPLAVFLSKYTTLILKNSTCFF